MRTTITIEHEDLLALEMALADLASRVEDARMDRKYRMWLTSREHVGIRQRAVVRIEEGRAA